MATPMATAASKVIPKAIAKAIPKVGVVIAAGRCEKTVKVRVTKTVKDGHIRKYLTHHDDFLAHDENTSCVVGDVVTVHPGRTSSTKRHVVTSIISPISTPHTRPRPETYEEYLSRRESEYNARRIRKLQGENAEKYFIKYAKDIPKEVKHFKKIWLAQKNKEKALKLKEMQELKQKEEEEKVKAKDREERKAIRAMRELENEKKKSEMEKEKEKVREQEQRKEERGKEDDGPGSGAGGTSIL